MSVRIVCIPFVYPDGGIEVSQEVVSDPDTVEIDGAWVHVMTPRSFGAEKRRSYRVEKIRSYPAHEIQRIEWNYTEDAS